MSKHAVERVISRLGQKAGIRRVYPHLLRHTFATNYLVHQCGDVLRLQQILGHTSLEMVRYYAEAAAIQRDLIERRSSPMDVFVSGNLGKRTARKIGRGQKVSNKAGKIIKIESRKLIAESGSRR